MKYYKNDNIHEVAIIMSVNTAKEIKIAIEAFESALLIGGFEKNVSEIYTANYIIEKFLDDEDSRRSAEEDHCEFLDAVKKKIKKLT